MTVRLYGLARRVRYILALVCVALGVVSCGSQPATNQLSRPFADGGIRPPVHLPIGWSVTYPVDLPHGYNTITGIASSATGHDLWVFAQGPDERLFHIMLPNRVVKSYSLDPAGGRLHAGLETPVAIASSGTVWVGVNESLLELDQATGEVRTTRLPPVSVGAPDSGLPQLPVPNGGAYAGIDALTIRSDGSIIVGREFATAIQIFNPATKAVTALPLPPRTALVGLGSTDLAQDADGSELAAALYAPNGVDELGQYSNGAWTLSGGCPAYGVVIYRSEITVSGSHCVAYGAINGHRAAGLSLMSGAPLPNWTCAYA